MPDSLPKTGFEENRLSSDASTRFSGVDSFVEDKK